MTYRLTIIPEQIDQDLITLDSQQLHYLLRVLRLGNGDRFLAMDGGGNTWLAEIKEHLAKIIESVEVDNELPVSLTLVTALPKGSGYEQIIRCGTELGVSKFIPVISDRTLLKPSLSKVQRWRKIATEASEQSERQIIPQVMEPVKFRDAISESSTSFNQHHQYICVARGYKATLSDSINSISNQALTEIVIATGCEGGWTAAEIEQAIACGFQPVSLGRRILRAITAPIVVCSLVAARLESDKFKKI
ncbi:MAG: 16S rRNA (uracil(1498)-N(3))-methyltransferase [Cyanobacteria bacterium J06621_8]